MGGWWARKSVHTEKKKKLLQETINNLTEHRQCIITVAPKIILNITGK